MTMSEEMYSVYQKTGNRTSECSSLIYGNNSFTVEKAAFYLLNAIVFVKFEEKLSKYESDNCRWK